MDFPLQINRKYPQMQHELFPILTELSPRKKAVSQIHLADTRKKWFRKSSSYFLATFLTAKALSGMGLVKTGKIFGVPKEIESSSVHFRLYKNLSGQRSRYFRTLICEVITTTTSRIYFFYIEVFT